MEVENAEDDHFGVPIVEVENDVKPLKWLMTILET